MISKQYPQVKLMYIVKRSQGESYNYYYYNIIKWPAAYCTKEGNLFHKITFTVKL